MISSKPFVATHVPRAGTVRPFDTSAVRPEGSILKTFGGLASGPAPLHRLHKFAVDLFTGAAGRKLTTVECHDLVCNIGEVVVVGGVRRCAPASCALRSQCFWACCSGRLFQRREI